MNLNARITLRFLLQIGALFIVVWAIIGVALGFYFVGKRASITTDRANPVAVLKKMPRSTRVNGNVVTVSSNVLSEVKQNHSWLQILNSGGDSIYNFNVPRGVPGKYAPGLLVYDKLNPLTFRYQLFTWYSTVDGRQLTWLYGLPLSASTGDQTKPYMYILTLFLGSLIATLVAAFLFGRRIGAPILHMMNWLQNLANQSYAEPTDGRGVPKSKRAVGGQLRRTYRMYRDVLATLEHLASALQKGEVERERLERTREEWITGITHDLRTPLSSVKGYGDLLASTNYVWSEKEFRQAGRVISEKAAYMDGLIEDLGLTFRLMNDALPMQRNPENVVEIVRNVVIDLVNHPRTEGQKVEFDAEVEQMMYPLDAKWFARAVDNLVINASLHNPVGTIISVRVQAELLDNFHYPAVRIEIRDDGEGMDEETLAHLFDRYYRGTNTSEEEVRGSGLGTAIAKQLIEAHTGQISVHSAVGCGTCVVIALPPQN